MGVGGASTVTEKVANILDKFPGGPTAVDSIEFIVSWARANSLWPLVYGTACCAMEMMAAGSSKHDWARFGVDVARATPRQADLIVLAGTIVEKMGNNLVTLYEQMPGPKYVIAMGSCAISGGPFYYDSYSVIKGGDRLIPVDVYVPGCPPRPEALLFGLMELQRKIRKEGRHNPWRIGTLMEDPFIDSLTETRKRWLENEKIKDKELAEARERFKAENPDYKPIKGTRVAKEKFAEIDVVPKTTTGLDNQAIFTLVREQFPEVQLFRQDGSDQETPTDSLDQTILDLHINQSDYTGLIEFLKGNSSLKMELLLQLTAVDWKDHFDVIVQLLSVDHGHKVFVRCSIDHDAPALATISHIFKGADWHEREAYDLFGINFIDHPDLRRIFLKNTFVGHPLRKDFDDPIRVIKRPY